MNIIGFLKDYNDIWLEWHLLTVTLLPFPEGVTVSGEICTKIIHWQLFAMLMGHLVDSQELLPLNVFLHTILHIILSCKALHIILSCKASDMYPNRCSAPVNPTPNLGWLPNDFPSSSGCGARSNDVVARCSQVPPAPPSHLPIIE